MKTSKRHDLAAITRVVLSLAIVFVDCMAVGAQPDVTTYLSDLDPVSARQGWGQPGMDRSVQGNPLRIGRRTFARGIGTHASSEIVYALEQPVERFKAWVGIDAEMAGYALGTVVFRVVADRHEVFRSGVVRVDTPPVRVSVPLTGVRELRLVADDAGDGINCDHADWADAALIGPKRPVRLPVARYSVRVPGLRLGISENGDIAGMTLGPRALVRPVHGELRLSGLRAQGATRGRREPGGGMAFAQRLASPDGVQRCTLVQRFVPAGGRIRWEADVRAEKGLWSAPVRVRLTWPVASGARFWTAWSDPEMRNDRWRDPLQPRPFADLNLPYGTGGNGFCLPLAVVLDGASGAGLSLAPSPDSTLLGLSLSTRRTGAITFTHTGHRFQSGRIARFVADLAPHAPDIRAALGWMVQTYPDCFEPRVPAVRAMTGCGAYSSYEGPLGVAKMRRMGFRMNWKASFDFPYMGMFLPPVPGETDTWPRFDTDSAGNPVAGRHTFTSRQQMNDYSRQMRRDGFYVLNYFNVTEFGAALKEPESARRGLPDSEVWRDPTDFLFSRVADGVLPTPDGGRYGTWGGAVAMDPGGPAYRRFLLEQVRRHVEKLPDSAGICIDRTDWLAFTNPHGDDGISWIDGRPARSLLISWRRLMGELGPMMHRAGKVLFANPLLSRLELYRQVDGIYAEFGNQPGPFNTAALLGLRKPVMEWTASEADLRPDPDAFFQRHLYMGVFPTVPYPGNDHTIGPGAWAEQQYEDYGPLLDALRGRIWALWPRAVEAEGSVSANLFETPGRYIIPVVFGGKARIAHVRVCGLRAVKSPLAFEALLPGGLRAPVVARHHGGTWQLDVPLRRGCAVVRCSTLNPTPRIRKVAQ